jgi:hydroxymethylpyrimidine kinase/phosphomethylpyrimidine kinase
MISFSKLAPRSLYYHYSRHHYSALLCLSLLLRGLHVLLALSVSVAATSRTSTPIVLSIAGSDSGGGAGIQADLHAIHSFGCHGCTAITCVTAQNSVGVSAVHEIPSTFLRKQLDSLWEDLPPSSIKIGMISSSDNAKEIGKFLASFAKKKQQPWIVCDPVMISTSGSALISDEAKKTMIEEIFPYTDVLTPNKYEAEALLGRKLNTFADVEKGMF